MNAGRNGHSDNIASPYSVAFMLIHLGCFAVFWTGVSSHALVLGLALYWIRIFAIGAGYHRYFAHRAFRTSRAFQFVLAFLSQTAAQRSILWWAAKHRQHHMHSDTDFDVHSPVLRSFFYAHVGWIFVARNNAIDYQSIGDLTRYKELLWLDRHSYLPLAALALLTWLVAGWSGLAIGFCCSTVAVWHVTFSVNSLSHLVGRQRYITGDQSRNNWVLALLTMGEGWHNNHHAYQASVRQGFRWWEFDPTFYMLRALSWLGLVWDLHVPPKAVVKGEHKLGRRVINKVGCQLAASFPVDLVARQASEALARAPDCAELKARILAAEMQPEAFWAEIDLPQLPTLDEVRRYARAQLAQTPSLNEIALSTRQRLLELVYLRLIEAAASSSANLRPPASEGPHPSRRNRYIPRIRSSAMAGIVDRELSGKDKHAGQHGQADNP
jgi:stearoyl-CoA desaturase (Delta-9 desaturase)